MKFRSLKYKVYTTSKYTCASDWESGKEVLTVPYQDFPGKMITFAFHDRSVEQGSNPDWSWS